MLIRVSVDQNAFINSFMFIYITKLTMHNIVLVFMVTDTNDTVLDYSF